jgi:phytoene dehydrogenase-like protein
MTAMTTTRPRVIVIGAGMGGLTAALRLAQAGIEVQVLEARDQAGGLASGFSQDGFAFDGGPYILLDRPGLDWAFRALDLDLEEHLTLRKIEDVYEVSSGVSADEPPVRFLADLEATAAGFERRWPGSGAAYTRFVKHVAGIHERLRPMLHISRPGIGALVRAGGLRAAPFLLRSLHSVLESAGLPRPVRDAIAIWTHVAGQDAARAPSPMAFVPALIHSVGSYYPVGGIARIPAVLAGRAAAAGIEIRHGTKVRAVRCEGDRVTGVETVSGEVLAADAVLSDAAGVGTYVELVGATPQRFKRQLEALPLQSPGVSAYLAVRSRGKIEPPYLRFRLPSGGALCRALILPAVVDPGTVRDGFAPARLLSPMVHEDAERGGVEAQRAYLEEVLADPWWRASFEEVKVLATRIPAEWGARYHLYRDSMNPVMTASFMRRGRIAHKSPVVRGLYLCGSATHPGQWVSFAAISGILAADRLKQDLAP